jgi:hypothetical protein
MRIVITTDHPLADPLTPELDMSASYAGMGIATDVFIPPPFFRPLTDQLAAAGGAYSYRSSSHSPP